MKNNIRKYAKALIASVLSLTIVLQAFNGLSFASEATTETDVHADKVIIPTAETVTVGDASTNGVTDSSITFTTASEYNTSGGVFDLFSGYSDITSILNVLGNNNGTAFVLKFTEPIDVSEHNVMTVNAVIGAWSDNSNTFKVNMYGSGATDLATDKAIGSFETVGNFNKSVTFTLDLEEYADADGLVRNLTFRLDTASSQACWVAFGAFRLSYNDVHADTVIIPTAETVTVGDASTNGVTDSSTTFTTASEYNTSGGVFDLFSGYGDITSILNVLGNNNGTAFVLKFTEPIDVSNHNVMTVNAVIGAWTDGSSTFKVNMYGSGATDLATDKAIGSFETVGNFNQSVTFTLDLEKYADADGLVRNLTFRLDTASTQACWVAFGAFRLSYNDVHADTVIIPTAETVTVGDASTNGVTDSSTTFTTASEYNTSGGVFDLFSGYGDITSILNVLGNNNGTAFVLKFTEPIDVSNHNVMTVNAVIGAWTDGSSTFKVNMYGSGATDLATDKAIGSFETVGNFNQPVTFTLDLSKYADADGLVRNLTFRLDTASTQACWVAFGAFRLSYDATAAEPDTPEEPTYTELAFGDWSTSVGVVEGSNIYSLAGHDDITSLDGVAISGKVNFNGSSWLRIGGTESVKHGGLWLGCHSAGLYMTPQGIGGSGDYFPMMAVEWDELKNTEITLRLTFDKAEDGSSWTVGVFVNEADKGSYTIEGLNPGLYIGIDPTVTVDMTTSEPDTPDEPDEPTYTELAFSDWSSYVGVAEGSNIYSLAGHDDITSLDGVAISGKVNFNGSSWLRIGGTESVKHGGVWFGSHGAGLYMTPQGIGGSGDYFPVDATEWDELKNTEITLRLTFDKAEDGSSWTVGVFVNEADKGSYTIEGLNPGLYIGVDPAVTVDMTTGTPDTPDIPDEPDDSKTYTDLTFSDWGILDGEYISGYAYGLTNGLTSLDGTAFNGVLNFNGTPRWLRIGAPNGWEGLLLTVRENTLIIDSEVSGFSSLDYTVPYTEKNLLTEDFELRLTFDYDSDNNVKLGVWIDDEFQRYLTYKGMAAAMGTNLLIDEAGVTIADVGTKDEEADTTPTEKAELPENLTEVTFESFGIEDGTYKYNGNLLAAEGQYARPLGSSIFSGDFYIPSGSNVDFRYGGVSLNWFGLIFANTADGKLYLEGIADDVKVTNSYVFNPAKAGTEFIDTWFNMKLTTEIVDSDSDGAKDDVKLGVWFNDVLYNNKYIELQDYAQYLGNRVGVYVRDADSSVKLKSDTTVYMGVDFTLFGFTRNWEKELGLK